MKRSNSEIHYATNAAMCWEDIAATGIFERVYLLVQKLPVVWTARWLLAGNVKRSIIGYATFPIHEVQTDKLFNR